MKKPWDNEPTPMTDAKVRTIGDSPFLNWSEMQRHARELERRMRHAERLLDDALLTYQHGMTTLQDVTADNIMAHLTAAKEGAK
jgi:hypothetical protein